MAGGKWGDFQWSLFKTVNMGVFLTRFFYFFLADAR
jgi:hypothetical protein